MQACYVQCRRIGAWGTCAGQAAHAAIASAMANANNKKSRFRGVNANWSRWRAQVRALACLKWLTLVPCRVEEPTCCTGPGGQGCCVQQHGSANCIFEG
jgi:hypothetical protein